jgi:DNA-binding transcriptional regulator YhcF (GntR family)
MTKSTKEIYNQYQKEHFIKEQMQENKIKEKFENFLDEVIKDDISINQVKKVIDSTIQAN